MRACDLVISEREEKRRNFCFYIFYYYCGRKKTLGRDVAKVPFFKHVYIYIRCISWRRNCAQGS